MFPVLESLEQFFRFIFRLKESGDIGILNPLFAATDKKNLAVTKLKLTLLDLPGATNLCPV